MKAAVMKGFGGPEVFEIENLEDLIPKGEEVLIEVKAAGINRPDVFQRKGNYPAMEGVPQDIPGLEVSGIIRSVGPSARRFKVGDSVMALVPGAGYASQVCVSERVCLQKPKNLSFEEAAALPETIYTVWNNLFERGGLRKAEHVLIHGGTGGIGSIAIQLAKSFGAIVYTTVGTEEKKAIALELGADIAINYKVEDFEKVLKDLGVDVILDSIGGAYFHKHLNILNEDGRLVQINAVAGAKVELNLLKLMQKRILLTGSTLRSRDIEFKSRLTKEIETNILPLIEKGEVKPLLTKIYPLEEVVAAHRDFESSGQYGKIVLRMES